MNGASRRASSRSTGSCTDPTSSASSSSPSGTGENAPMPPVFGPCVAVERALEVSCGREAERGHAVADREHRQLVALEQLFDHEVVADAGHGAERGVELVLRAADEDTLACGEPVRLDDAGRPRDREPLGRRNAGGLHDLFREALRAFDLRRRGARPEHRDAAEPKCVGDAGHERHLGTDHDEVDRERAREREQALRVLRVHRVARPETGDPRVTGRGVQLGQPRALRELPGERMLAPARPHDQNLHVAGC